MHQHWGPQSPKGKHSLSWTHSLPPHFSRSLRCSPSSLSSQVVSKDILSHSPLSAPFLAGSQCQHISTSPSWPHKCHNTTSFRFRHSHPHLSSCHQQAWEKSHRIALCHLESTFYHCLPFQVVLLLQHREFSLTKGTIPSPPLCCPNPLLQEHAPLILANSLLKLGYHSNLRKQGAEGICCSRVAQPPLVLQRRGTPHHFSFPWHK